MKTILGQAISRMAGLAFVLAAAGIAATTRAQIADQMERGQQLYLRTCAVCHLPDGKGLPDLGVPPLAGSDFLLADKSRAIRISLKGIVGPITVLGRNYNSLMPRQELVTVTTLRTLDEQVADVLTYITNSWDNQGGPVTTEEVVGVRARDAAFLGRPPRPSDDARSNATPNSGAVTPAGRTVYLTACANCHLENGRGYANIPPLAGSDFLSFDTDRTIRILITGLDGPILVNNRTYDALMPVQVFNDEQIAEVVNYVLNMWGNGFGMVNESDVQRVRDQD